MPVIRRPDAKPPPASLMQQVGMLTSIGTNFAFGAAGLGAIGWALSKWVLIGTHPWLMIGGAVLGLIAGGVRFVIEAQAAVKKNANPPRRPGST